MRVLIVDDNINDREGVRDLIDWEKLGFDSVVCARNGQEGYERAKELQPTLVLTDVSMPIIDGIHMADMILDIYPQTKFIFFSCFDDVEYLTAAIKTRAFGYLLKPIDLGQLEEVIQKVVKVDSKEKKQSEELSYLKTKIAEYSSVVQSALLRDYVFGAIKPAPGADLFDFYQRGYYAVAIVSINAGGETEEESYGQIFVINDLILHLDRGNIRIDSFVMGSTSIAVLVNVGKKEGYPSELDDILCLFQRIQNLAADELGLAVNVCIGGGTEDFKRLPFLFHNAEHVLRSGYVYAGIVFAEDIQKRSLSFDYNLTELKKRIELIVEHADYEELQNFVEEYYNDETLSFHFMLQAFSFEVLSILQIILTEENESFSKVFGEEHSVWDKLQDYQSISNIKNWIYNVFKSIIEYLQEKQASNSQNGILIKQIKKIISEDFYDIEKISQITSRLYISTSYANHIFKKQEGKTIFEYMNEMKIDKAKELLSNDRMKVGEVAEVLGYKPPSYFGMVFKEKVGVTPGQYRDMCIAKRDEI